MKRLIVGISGATGVQMGYRLLQALRTFEDIRDRMEGIERSNIRRPIGFTV